MPFSASRGACWVVVGWVVPRVSWWGALWVQFSAIPDLGPLLGLGGGAGPSPILVEGHVGAVSRLSWLGPARLWWGGWPLAFAGGGPSGSSFPQFLARVRCSLWWDGWTLATPGGGPCGCGFLPFFAGACRDVVGWVVRCFSWRRALCVLFPATPGSRPLPSFNGVGGPSPFLAEVPVGVVPRHSWPGPAPGFGALGGPSLVLAAGPVGSLANPSWLGLAAGFSGVAGPWPFLAEGFVGAVTCHSWLGLATGLGRVGGPSPSLAVGLVDAILCHSWLRLAAGFGLVRGSLPLLVLLHAPPCWDPPSALLRWGAARLSWRRALWQLVPAFLSGVDAVCGDRGRSRFFGEGPVAVVLRLSWLERCWLRSGRPFALPRGGSCRCSPRRSFFRPVAGCRGRLGVLSVLPPGFACCGPLVAMMGVSLPVLVLSGLPGRGLLPTVPGRVALCPHRLGTCWCRPPLCLPGVCRWCRLCGHVYFRAASGVSAAASAVVRLFPGGGAVAGLIGVVFYLAGCRPYGRCGQPLLAGVCRWIKCGGLLVS